MNLKSRGKITGTFPKSAASVTTEPPYISMEAMIEAVGPEIIAKFNSRKTFSVVAPRSLKHSETLELIKKGCYEIKDFGREVQIHVKLEE